VQGLDAFTFVAAIGGAFLNAGSITFVVWEALRSSPPSEEEIERADMRSCSWPTPQQTERFAVCPRTYLGPRHAQGFAAFRGTPQPFCRELS
jgi:hypothetical protein